ncbi:MAG: acyl-CoA dehydratase activase [Phycisphaerae bacterium]|nr:acyl-CoA dehydratase activase [Phycisphaerae bacterium]
MSAVPLYVGIDAGSSATKCVVLAADGTIVGHGVVSSGFDYAEAADAALTLALGGTGLDRGDVACCVSTGYGRKNVRGAQRHVTEISCHARGARAWYPEVRGIVDIGGQDTKVIWIDARGELVDYRMNSKCAAGTGTFLESVAVRLGVPLSAIDALAMTSTAHSVLNSYCTVFTGTEVIERIKSGEPRQDISMGLFRSIAARVFEMCAARDGPIAATGGVVAHCRAMLRALEEIFGAPPLLPPWPQQAGAYGAALLAREVDPHDLDERPRSAQSEVSA